MIAGLTVALSVQALPAAAFPPVGVGDASPKTGGCDVAALTCAAAVTLAGHACINMLLEADTDFHGRALFIIPVSGSAHTEVEVSGCMGYAAGGVIGMTNDFPSLVEWTVRVRSSHWTGDDWEEITREIVEDSCITPVGIAQYCADSGFTTVPSETPPCMHALAYVHVDGNAFGTPIYLPDGTVVLVGTAYAHAASREGQCAAASTWGNNVATMSGSPGTPIGIDQLDEAARELARELFTDALIQDIESRFANLAEIEQEDLVDLIERRIVDQVQDTLGLEDTILWRIS